MPSSRGNLPVPPGAPPQVRSTDGPLRGRELSSALIGNGSVLATISARGELLRLWWPHPDRGQHLGELRLGLELDGEVRWLDEEPFEWMQEWVGDSTILRTTGRSQVVTVELDDLVLPNAPVLVRQVSCRVAGARLVVTCRPELDERDRGMGAFVDEGTGAIVFHRTPYALALAASHDAESSCSGFGRVHGAIVAPLDGRVELVCAFGATPAAAVKAADSALGTSFEQHAEARRRVDAGRLAPAAAPSDVAPLYRRSLLVFDTLADAETGAVIAAPELDPDFVRSGGYGFVWPRDLAFLALAFLVSRRRDLAARALQWLPTAQEDSGLWLQRHWTDGTPGPAWCEHQLDETGSVLFAYEAAWRELRDTRLDEALWPSARRAADALLGTLDEQGIPCASADLWEERDGRHSYTAAATSAGLDAAASFARRHEPDLAATYSSAAERVRCALDRCFWSDEHGRYLRTLGDATVDVSLLGLAWPFRAVDPAGERMRATADAVGRALARPGGGLMRYEGDTYAGGNPWVLAALWHGLYRRQVGDADGLRRALAYAERVATPLGLLAEQVTDQGEPAWVLPLAWSHALLVLSVRPELEAVRARPAVARSPVRGSQ